MTGTVMTATDLAPCWNALSAGVFSTQRARMTTQSSRMKTRLSVLFARYTCHFNVVVMQTNGNDVAILAWLTDLHEIFREGWQWVSEQMVKFWWRSGSLSGGVLAWLSVWSEVQMICIWSS